MRTKIDIFYDNLFENDFNINKREIYLFGDINEDSASKLVKTLLALDGLSSGTITIFINSEGGSVHDAMAIYDVCVNLRSPLRVVALGSCMSAATLVLLAGDIGKRFVCENTTLMVHECSLDLSGKFKDVVNETKALKKLEEKWHAIFDERTKTTAKKWTQLSQSDYYFNAPEALEMGLADLVWKNKKR